MNNGWTYRDRITSSAAGQTVLAYYTQRYTHSTQQTWQARIDQGQICLNDRPTTVDTVLIAGAQLSYHRPPWQEPPVPLDFDVLYEDEHLWVIAKPVGLPVLPGGGFMENTLLHLLRDGKALPMEERFPDETPIPVHRLGRGTSGAMLVAKSQTARSELSRQFRVRSTSSDASVAPLRKIYRALVGPSSSDPNAQTFLKDGFSCTFPIGKLPHTRLGYVYGRANRDDPKAMTAHSKCTVVERRSTATLLDVSISTGRPHQIRIHLAAAGFPLIGDPLYPVGGIPSPSSAAKPSDIGYHLHAYQLRFVHPYTGHPISITAEPPKILRPIAK